MTDCIGHAMRYRKNLVTSKDVATLFNGAMKELQELAKTKHVTGAVVFAMAGPQIEFGLVNDYGINGWNIRKDTEVMLSFIDPVGVVGLSGADNGAKGLFRTFKGKDWAQQYADQIIDQAYHSLPMYALKPPLKTKMKKKAR